MNNWCKNWFFLTVQCYHRCQGPESHSALYQGGERIIANQQVKVKFWMIQCCQFILTVFCKSQDLYSNTERCIKVYIVTFAKLCLLHSICICLKLFKFKIQASKLYWVVMWNWTERHSLWIWMITVADYLLWTFRVLLFSFDATALDTSP